MAPDLIVFLLAQLALDEAAANAGARRVGMPWRADPQPGTPGGLVTDELGLVGSTGGSYAADHIARHDPARTLREVEAMRAILAEHGPANGGRDAGRCRVCTAITHTGMGQTDARRFRAPCPTLLFLAAIYSDHPDYRQEWELRA